LNMARARQTDETAKRMLDNYRTYSTCIGEHSILGKIPREAAEIDLTDDKTKWLDLLDQALSSSEGD